MTVDWILSKLIETGLQLMLVNKYKSTSQLPKIIQPIQKIFRLTVNVPGDTGIIEGGAISPYALHIAHFAGGTL